MAAELVFAPDIEQDIREAYEFDRETVTVYCVLPTLRYCISRVSGV